MSFDRRISRLRRIAGENLMGSPEVLPIIQQVAQVISENAASWATTTLVSYLISDTAWKGINEASKRFTGAWGWVGLAFNETFYGLNLIRNGFSPDAFDKPLTMILDRASVSTVAAYTTDALYVWLNSMAGRDLDDISRLERGFFVTVANNTVRSSIECGIEGFIALRHRGIFSRVPTIEYEQQTQEQIDEENRQKEIQLTTVP